MSDGTEVEEVEELGPAAWVVVEFPGRRFAGRSAPALADLAERVLVRVRDLRVLTKDSDGAVDAVERAALDDDEIGGLPSFAARLAPLVSEDDVVAGAEAL